MFEHPELSCFRSDFGDLDRESFLVRFKEPFIVFGLKLYKEDPRDFRTLAATLPDRPTEFSEKNEEVVSTHFVAEVSKSERNSFGNMITVGRSENNDIRIPHGSVSKFHAFFRKDLFSREMTLQDAGSRFGTYLNGNKVTPTAGVPVASGDSILFARQVASTYYSPQDFFDYLRLPPKPPQAGRRPGA